MANFGEMGVALLVARHSIENEIARVRQVAGRIGLHKGSVMIAIEGFERDIHAIDEAASLLKLMAEHEAEIREFVKRKGSAGKTWMARLMDVATAASLML